MLVLESTRLSPICDAIAQVAHHIQRTYDSNSIQTAIGAAVGAIQVDKLYYAPHAALHFPRVVTPGNGSNGLDQWTDYNLPQCAQAGSSKDMKAAFFEFPIYGDSTVFSSGIYPGPVSEKPTPTVVLMFPQLEGFRSITVQPYFWKLANRLQDRVLFQFVPKAINQDGFDPSTSPYTTQPMLKGELDHVAFCGIREAVVDKAKNQFEDEGAGTSKQDGFYYVGYFSKCSP